MKNITFSADDELIEAARARARAEHTTLNEQFRLWLADCVQQAQQRERYEETILALRSTVRAGRELSRDEMNER